MAAVLTTAAHTMTAINQLTGQPQRKAGSPKNHWSYGVLVFSAIVGAIAAIAGGILAQIPLAVIGIVMCITGIIGSVSIKKLKVLKTLEGYVDQFSERVTRLGEVVQGLQQVNHDKERINQELRDTLEERTHVLELANARLDKMTKMCQSLQGVAVEISKEMSEVTTQNDQLNKEVSDAITAFQQFDVTSQRLGGEVGELASQNKRFDEEDEEFKGLVAQLQSNVQILKNGLKKQREEVSALRKTARSIEKLRGKLTESTQQLARFEKFANEDKKKIDAIVKQLSHLQHIPELVALLNEIKSDKPKLKPKKAAQ